MNTWVGLRSRTIHVDCTLTKRGLSPPGRSWSIPDSTDCLRCRGALRTSQGSPSCPRPPPLPRFIARLLLARPRLTLDVAAVAASSALPLSYPLFSVLSSLILLSQRRHLAGLSRAAPGASSPPPSDPAAPPSPSSSKPSSAAGTSFADMGYGEGRRRHPQGAQKRSINDN